jgi:hypothetical protein
MVSVPLREQSRKQRAVTRGDGANLFGAFGKKIM